MYKIILIIFFGLLFISCSRSKNEESNEKMLVLDKPIIIDNKEKERIKEIFHEMGLTKKGYERVLQIHQMTLEDIKKESDKIGINETGFIRGLYTLATLDGMMSNINYYIPDSSREVNSATHSISSSTAVIK